MSGAGVAPRLLVLDNTCLSAFSSAGLMNVLQELTTGFRVGTTEAVRQEFLAGPHPPSDVAWVDLLAETGIDELAVFADYVRATAAGEPQVVTKHGKAIAVVIDYAEYELVRGTKVSFLDYIGSPGTLPDDFEVECAGDLPRENDLPS